MKWFKPRSIAALSARGIVLALVTASLTSCATQYYYFPEYNFAGRPVPPSKLAERVMVSITTNGAGGNLQILDGKRDIRSNVENTQTSFHIGGYSGAYPSLIVNYPVQQRGYIYSSTDGSLGAVNYGTESSLGSAGSLGGVANSFAVAQDDSRIIAAVEQAGQLTVIDNGIGRSYSLNLPNVYQVAMNSGNTVLLAMVRNSNALYRVVKLVPNTVYNTASNAVNPLFPPGAVDCQPYVLPVYCVVPVPTTANALNEPMGAYFSLDGSTVYIINCGTECGGPNPATLPGSTASITPFQAGALTVDNIPSTASPSPVVNTASIGIPGGVTEMISDGTNLYLAGQQLQPDGYFAGELTVIPLATMVPGTPMPISDGNHSKILFAGDGTLWIGSQFCSNGERAQIAARELATQGYTDNAGNYNCLTALTITQTATSTTFSTPTIVPAVVQTNPAIAPKLTPVPVGFPNQDLNPYYYGSLTGLCWVEDFHKVYTAYGGQVHAFYTGTTAPLGTEIDNSLITVQGTALDVAYLDATTNVTD